MTSGQEVGTTALMSDTLEITTVDLLFHQCLSHTILKSVAHQSDILFLHAASLFALLLTTSAVLVKAYIFSPYKQSLCMPVLEKIPDLSTEHSPPTDWWSILS